MRRVAVGGVQRSIHIVVIVVAVTQKVLGRRIYMAGRRRTRRRCRKASVISLIRRMKRIVDYSGQSSDIRRDGG